MKENELRIGNYVKHKYCGKIEIDFNSLRSVSKEELQENTEKCHKPILLTEEWLFKFGYELMPSGTYLAPNSGNFIWFENDLKDCSIAGEYYMQHIKYVHQLQNLYFALTNLELTTK